MIASLFDLTLCLLILAVAGAAVFGRAAFMAVVFFIVYGILIAIAWLRLGAIDVALAEAAIGAGLTGVLLLAALSRIMRNIDAPEPAPVLEGKTIATGLASLVVTALVAHAFLTLPEPRGLQSRVTANLADAGAENPVTAVLLNFRGWDTLLESIVLLAALLGVWTLARDDAWSGRAGLRHVTRPGGVLAQFGRILPPIGLLVGIYLVWAGSKQPGGAFQGGTVLAAVWIVTIMAGLMQAPRVADRALRAALVIGPVIFLALAVAGVFAGAFLVFPPAHAGWLILAVEAVLTLSIAATLAMLIFGPPEGEEKR
ncbi:hydrogenase subunit MbhD domain-containing protein [Saliniramus sp.]|uniref:hydrogenase subunit MbhD domain-containing protein n=1 Tax=Saliniramus sp. TaxID=2986772 RepID=UPI002C5973C3|nr:hydrogenase subunit MbhD domain-containing protein [Saliniramus sp.]HMB09055.1 hydrogenase subunit MbhD domain-containing protein [Saliniramus sp.]